MGRLVRLNPELPPFAESRMSRGAACRGVQIGRRRGGAPRTASPPPPSEPFITCDGPGPVMKRQPSRAVRMQFRNDARAGLI